MTEIVAARLVSVPPEAVFVFLSDLANHWWLATRFVEVVDLDPSVDGHGGGRVRVRGPLGLRRTAVTRVEHMRASQLVVGSARVGRTRARVSWTLEARGAGTWVRLAATVERASTLDRLLLRAGGRAWLERRFAGTLARLDEIAIEESSVFERTTLGAYPE